MSETEKIEMLTSILGNAVDEDLIAVYLNMAKREILAWRYSYASGDVPLEVPTEYEMTQIYAVVAGYGISGAEGQTSHTENGISRTFKFEDMIAYIRAHVIPIARCL